jgi:hypothetical protein
MSQTGAQQKVTAPCAAYALECLKLDDQRESSTGLMHCSFFKFTLVLNSVVLLWKLLVLDLQLGILQDFYIFAFSSSNSYPSLIRFSR